MPFAGAVMRGAAGRRFVLQMRQSWRMRLNVRGQVHRAAVRHHPCPATCLVSPHLASTCTRGTKCTVPNSVLQQPACSIPAMASAKTEGGMEQVHPVDPTQPLCLYLLPVLLGGMPGSHNGLQRPRVPVQMPGHVWPDLGGLG